jgi:hypothetical protein
MKRMAKEQFVESERQTLHGRSANPLFEPGRLCEAVAFFGGAEPSSKQKFYRFSQNLGAYVARPCFETRGQSHLPR